MLFLVSTLVVTNLVLLFVVWDDEKARLFAFVSLIFSIIAFLIRLIIVLLG